MDPCRLVSTDSLVKLQRLPQRCPCTHGFPLLCMLPRHSPWPPFHAPWHGCGPSAEQCQSADRACYDDGELAGNSAGCSRPPWDDSPAEEFYESRSHIEAQFDKDDAHGADEHREAGSVLMRDASTQWQLQHVRRKFKGVRHPHAWVPPGLHVVPPPNQHAQQKVSASQQERKPFRPHEASRRPSPGPVRKAAHDDKHSQSQADCTCQIAADICSDDRCSGTYGVRDSEACHAWAAGCCSESLASPGHHAKSRLGNNRCHHSGGQSRFAAQPYMMHSSGLAQTNHLEGPWNARLHAEQPQASAGNRKDFLDNHCSDNSAEHQAPVLLSQQGSRHVADVNLQPLKAMPEARIDHGDFVTQGSHEQLLADIDSFISSLQRPPLAARSILQPEHTAAEEGPVHAARAEDALPRQPERPAVLLNMSTTEEGTVIATAYSRRCGSEWEETLRSLVAKLDCSQANYSAGQQHVDAPVDDGHSNSSLLLAAAGTGDELYEKQEQSSATWQEDQHSTKGVSTGSRLGLFRHKGKTLLETDQAAHKLHDLEDVAQASLDELEDLLREQQLKLAGMGLLPQVAANPSRHMHGRHLQHRRRPQRSALHAMADALSFATEAY